MRSVGLFSLLILLIIGSGTVLAQTGEDDSRVSYLICDWGLLAVEEPPANRSPFISIDSPADYSAVPGTRLTVSGSGAGLFEGNVIVEFSAGESESLFSGTTVLQAENISDEGTWSIDIDLGDLEPGTRIWVTAYSTSPADGSTVAYDSLRLIGNSEFGVPFAEVTRPRYGAGVSASPLLIEGVAGAAFENTIAIEVTNFATDELLAETFATIETEEFAGQGPFSTEVSLDVEPGTAIEVRAYHPMVADTDLISTSDVAFAIVSPLAQTYDRFLVLQADDPLNGAEDLCAVAEAEFNNENIQLLVINDVKVQSTRSMTPTVNVSVGAAGSSNCPAPLRTRVTRNSSAFDIEIYYDLRNPVPCTSDLAPIAQRVSLGTLPSPVYQITVNGQPVE